MTPFIKRRQKMEPGFTVGAILGRKPTIGDLGVEIEVEGTRLPKNEVNLAPWGYHHDGSLRGADNAEYVLLKPIDFDALPGALSTLWGHFAAYKSTIDDSNRTSVHIHLNCQNFHFNRLTSLMALWFCMEEVLTEWCGEHRVGNLFCLRAKDAPAMISMIRRFIQSDGKNTFPESVHYAGLNTHALQKFGSIEIRMLRGVSQPQVILDWVAILRRLYELSAKFPDPRDICGTFSAEGPASFFEAVLGDQAQTVRNGISFSEDRICDSMYAGIRLAQDLCYCRDWSIFQPVDIKADPFGRSLNKVMAKMGNNFNPEDDYGPAPVQMPSMGPMLLTQAMATLAPVQGWGNPTTL